MADQTNDSRPPLLQPKFLLSAGLLLLVAGSLVVVLVVQALEPEPTSGSTTPPSAPSAAAGPSGSAEDTSCGVPVNDQDIPVSGPDAEWTAKRYLLVPSSDEFGPVGGQDPLWPCFAHSPTGALFAAAHFLPGMVALPDYEQFARAAAVDAPALNSWLAEQNPETHNQSAGRTGQYVGYRFQSIEADEVLVDLGLQLGDASIYYRVSMVWDPGADNWKGDVATSQLEAPVPDDLSTFTDWEATNG